MYYSHLGRHVARWLTRSHFRPCNSYRTTLGIPLSSRSTFGFRRTQCPFSFLEFDCVSLKVQVFPIGAMSQKLYFSHFSRYAITKINPKNWIYKNFSIWSIKFYYLRVNKLLTIGREVKDFRFWMNERICEDNFRSVILPSVVLFLALYRFWPYVNFGPYINFGVIFGPFTNFGPYRFWTNNFGPYDNFGPYINFGLY